MNMPVLYYPKKKPSVRQIKKYVRAVVIVVLLIGSYFGTRDHAPPSTGVVRVVDGDTLALDDKRIRLFGIDAPEMKQSCSRETGKYLCGQAAKEALTDLIGTQPVTCQERDIDKYGRMVAICSVGSIEINTWLVSKGHAVAYKNYTDRYNAAEEEARAAKRGIWAGGFQQPSDYRRSHKN